MHDATIFVSIASYRDRLCTDTIQSLFDQSKNPQRIYVGVCQQGEEECGHGGSHVRKIKMDAEDAQGPAYARYLCSLLYRGEDYYFQIDSHCLFVRHWDEKILTIMEQARRQSPKPILSHYPRDFSDYHVDPDPDSFITVMRKVHKNPHGIITFGGAEFQDPTPTLYRSVLIGAGFLFVPGSFLKEVPFDPHLPHLFTGEEILLTLRAFTHGWDVFTPNQNILYHYYTREGEPKFWDWGRKPTDAEWKVKIMTGVAHPSDKKYIEDDIVRQSMDVYGMGTQRSMDEFYQMFPIQEGHLWWVVFVIICTVSVVCAIVLIMK